MRRRKKKNNNITKIILSACLVAILCFGVYKGGALFSEANAFEGIETIRLQASEPINSQATDWNLIIVNENNPVPKDYNLDLIKLTNDESVDARIYPSLQQMFDDARAVGVFPFVRAGYRTMDEQKNLMEAKINEYKEEGYSKAQSKEMAQEWVAIPGASEHQLGIAVDINADPNLSTRDDVYKWLKHNAHNYGFILRYPPDKSEITGIQYEPWHYRYVGTEVATEIYAQGLCLEEYLQ